MRAGPSRADTTDNWGTSRKFEPSSAKTSSSGGFEDKPRTSFPDRRRDDFEDAGEGESFTTLSVIRAAIVSAL